MVGLSVPSCSWGRVAQAWFCAALQGGSGKKTRSRYVDCEEKDYCLRLVAECGILLTFEVWHWIRLAERRGLAPAS